MPFCREMCYICTTPHFRAWRVIHGKLYKNLHQCLSSSKHLATRRLDKNIICNLNYCALIKILVCSWSILNENKIGILLSRKWLLKLLAFRYYIYLHIAIKLPLLQTCNVLILHEMQKHIPSCQAFSIFIKWCIHKAEKYFSQFS